VLARTTLGDVTSADLEAWVLALPEPRRRPAAAQDPHAWRRGLLEEMLVERALLEEGRGAGILDRPATRARLQEEVDAILVEEVRARCLARLPPIGDAEVRAYYDRHPEEVSHAGQVRLRHIFRRVARDAPASMREAARREMEGVLAELRSGASFEEMARTRSDSDTAADGGRIGRLNRGDLAPSLEAVVWKLKEGEISQLVPTPVGFHVFKLESHIPPFRMDFEEARERLRKRLAQQARERALQEQVIELSASLGARYRPDALAGADPGALLFELQGFRMTRADWEHGLAARPFAAQRARTARELLDEAVGDRLRLAEAQRTKLLEDASVARRVEELRRHTLLRLAREERLREALPERELREYHASHANRFMEPALHRLRLLTLAFSGGKVDYALYERLAAIAAEVRAGRSDLAERAAALSTDPSAARGGDTGFIRLDSIGEWAGPRAYAAVEALDPGQVSEPILVERYDPSLLRYRREGYMLVRLEEVRPKHLRPFEEVEARVREAALAERHAELKRRLDRDVLASIHARVYDRNL
jgi:parvulin-like peptidyl-prolyl isomerase